MSSTRTHILLALALFVAAIGAGCQNSATPSSQSMAPTQKALVISGGNSGGTVVLLPNADNTDVEMLSTSGTPMCDQCRQDAIKYFQTGQITPKCSVCGATRTPVNYTPPAATAGHN
jgi:hypothetical protein